jgi:DNA (cytosine-5)-methyltransferase 3A
MKVLSLFDGISCARVAIERAGIPIESYHACEIDKFAIQVAKKNYPSTVHLGDVREIKEKRDIDLLIGGSPCQDLSIAKKGRKGLDGDRSGLFWEYVRIRDLIKPKYFILENVASMPQKDKDIITEAMGVQPIMFNASLVSAQTRKRLFWTNIPFELPEDCGILLKDILQPDAEVDERMVNREGKAYTLTARYSGAQEHNSIERKKNSMVKYTETPQTGRNETKKLGYVGDKDHQAKRVYDVEGKLPALNAICNSMIKLGHIGEIKEGKDHANTQGGQAHRVYSDEGKSPTLSSTAPNVATTGLYDIKGIRKLTPIECERLQGLPDNYTEGVSTTQRYKCLGNAFNCDVIYHIIKGFKED